MTRLSPEARERGTVATLMKRSYLTRIPRLLKIQAAVTQGKQLSNYQINFLGKVFKDAKRAMPYIDKHPELQQMAVQTVSLYHDILDKALANETSATLKEKAPPIDFIQ